MKFKIRLENIINSGVDEETNVNETKKIRIINKLCLVAFILSFIFIILNLLIGNDKELLPMFFSILIFVIAFIINNRGRKEISLKVIIIGGTIVTVWATLINSIQVPAPYFNLALGVFSIFILESKFSKIFFSTFSILIFFILNGYQIIYTTFSSIDYSFVLIFLLGLLILVYQYNKEVIRAKLIIEKQTKNLAILQKEKFEREILRKEKDIETIVTNNRVQLKIKKNILDKLKVIKNNEDAKLKVKSLIVDLSNQIESQQNLCFLEENIKDVSSVFFEKLIKKHPKLSKKEKELCSFIKLRLSTKEIANLTGSSINTIYVTKNRLKTKLNLKLNTDIDSYLQTF